MLPLLLDCLCKVEAGQPNQFCTYGPAMVSPATSARPAFFLWVRGGLSKSQSGGGEIL